MGKQVNAEVDSKTKPELSLEYADLLKMSIEKAKVEFSNIQQQITLANIALQNLQDAQVREKNAFDTQISRERKQAEEDRNNKKNEFSAREHALNQGEQELTSRMATLEGREREMEKMMDERKALINDRLEVERLKSLSSQELENSQNARADVESKIQQVSIREQQLLEKQKQVDITDSMLNQRKEALDEQEKAIAVRMRNLDEVKAVLEPKLKDLQEIDIKNKSDLKDIELKNIALKDREAENQKIEDALIAKDNLQKQKALELASKEAELKRREMLVDKLENK